MSKRAILPFLDIFKTKKYNYIKRGIKLYKITFFLLKDTEIRGTALIKTMLTEFRFVQKFDLNQDLF